LAATILFGTFITIFAQTSVISSLKKDVELVPGPKPSTRSIEDKVFRQLIKLPYYGVFDNISYKVAPDNTVTLFGKVAVARNKKDAERAVKRIEGVREVVNRIEILPLSPSDDSIRRQTLRTLARTGGLFRYFQGVNPSVKIIVAGGHVELEGYVANRGDFNTMNIVANGVSGVFSVKNNLIIENERVR
jgi:hyperosmotically inducible protein